MGVLTFDNLLLSRHKTVEKTDARPSAIVCSEEAAGTIADLVRESLAPNTRAASSAISPISRAGEGGYLRSPRPSPRTSPHTQTF